MDALVFFREKARMCKKYYTYSICSPCSKTDCPIAKKFNDCIIDSKNEEKTKGIIEIVENWSKSHPAITLTEQQKTAIRGRIAEGWKWIANDKLGEIWFYEEKPGKDIKKGFYFNDSVYGEGQVCNGKISKIYDFVTFENSPLYLPDLLGGEE